MYVDGLPERTPKQNGLNNFRDTGFAVTNLKEIPYVILPATACQL